MLTKPSTISFLVGGKSTKSWHLASLLYKYLPPPPLPLFSSYLPGSRVLRSSMVDSRSSPTFTALRRWASMPAVFGHPGCSIFDLSYHTHEICLSFFVVISLAEERGGEDNILQGIGIYSDSSLLFPLLCLVSHCAT